jgi:cyclopropane fatty-acyl-phospholipid synthase-like methyltransferase
MTIDEFNTSFIREILRKTGTEVYKTKNEWLQEYIFSDGEYESPEHLISLIEKVK